MDLTIKELTLDSREVAEMIGKRHDNLLRDITTYAEHFSQNPNLDFDSFFIETSYTTGNGRKYKSYNLTRKGCEFVANKLTGEKGTLFTATYINRFHEMENATSYQVVKPPHDYVRKTGVPFNRAFFYNKAPVMTIDQLANLLQVSNETISKYLSKLDYHCVIDGEELKKFKEYNHILTNAPSLTIIDMNTAHTVAAKLNKFFDPTPYIVNTTNITLPIEQVKLAISHAELLFNIGKSLSKNKQYEKDEIFIIATTILANIGLWEEEITSETDINTRIGWNKLSTLKNAKNLLRTY